ncbi:HEAT repeat domain-containing protein [Acidobacteriota bacterium]
MKKSMDLPNTWEECPGMAGEDFIVRCPKCVKSNNLKRDLFLPGAEVPHEKLEYTGIRQAYLTKTRAIVAYIIASIITVIIVFTVVPSGKASAQGGVYLVGIPVLIVASFIFRTLFRVQVGIWKYHCDNCGRELIFASNGKMAAYGSVEGKELGKKTEGEKKVDEKAIESLAENLKNEDRKVKIEAVRALAGVDDIRRVGPLIEALKDNDERVRKEVANTLMETRNRFAIEALVNQFQTDESGGVKGHIAVLVTGKIKGIKAARNIFKGMQSKDKRIQNLAYMAFYNQRDKRALDSLILAMKESKAK